MFTHRKRRNQTALEVEGPHAQHNSVRVHPLLAKFDDQVRILRVVKDTVIAAALSILVSAVEHRLCELTRIHPERIKDLRTRILRPR